MRKLCSVGNCMKLERKMNYLVRCAQTYRQSTISTVYIHQIAWTLQVSQFDRKNCSSGYIGTQVYCSTESSDLNVLGKGRVAGFYSHFCKFQNFHPSSSDNGLTIFRSFSTRIPSAAELDQLSVSQLKDILRCSSMDFRDCIEKRELANRVSSNFSQLPENLQVQVSQALVPKMPPQPPASPPKSDVFVPPENSVQQFTGRQLYHDEQYVVNLFERARHSVVHITPLTQYQSLLKPQPTEIPAGAGSGFVWDNNGNIVTNYHVVQKSDTAQVVLPGIPTAFQALVSGKVPDKDLAVLKIQADASTLAALRPIEVGTSHSLKVGQRIFAIGSPFGLDQSLTSGIVSGLGRTIRSQSDRQISDVIQTDAAINPGNSGGPLLDSDGRLVGVNTMILSPSGAWAGVGFAIPSDTVRRSITQILRYGRVIRPKLGVSLLPDSQAKEVLNLARQQIELPRRGLVVGQVEAGSGADQSGLVGMRVQQGTITLGDVILEVGGQQVDRVEDLQGIIEQFNVGDLVPLKVYREGKEVVVAVPLLSEFGER